MTTDISREAVERRASTCYINDDDDTHDMLLTLRAALDRAEAEIDFLRTELECANR